LSRSSNDISRHRPSGGCSTARRARTARTRRRRPRRLSGSVHCANASHRAREPYQVETIGRSEGGRVHVGTPARRDGRDRTRGRRIEQRLCGDNEASGGERTRHCVRSTFEVLPGESTEPRSSNHDPRKDPRSQPSPPKVPE
jgi:hypothetical protein